MASIDWQAAFDRLVQEVLVEWPPQEAVVRNQVYDLVARLIGGNRADLVSAINKTLADNRVTEQEMAGLLAAVAEGWTKSSFFGNSFVQRLLQDLQDGVLSSREVAEVAAEWVADRIRNDNLKQLLKAAADGHLTQEDVEQALLDWLRRINRATMADQLEEMLDSGEPLSLRSVSLLISAYLIGNQKIPQVGATIQKQTLAVISALNQLGNDRLADILDALVEKKYARAARLVLQEIGVTADEALLSALLSGDLREIAEKYLVEAVKKAIPDATDAQAAALATTLADLFTGKSQLVAGQSEQEAIGITDPEKYAIFLRTRKVVYAAVRAVEGGPIVPGDAMAQPHIFAAAGIEAETKIKDLTAKENWPLLLECIWRFSQVEFNKSFGPPLNMDTLKAGGTLRGVYTAIRGALA